MSAHSPHGPRSDRAHLTEQSGGRSPSVGKRASADEEGSRMEQEPAAKGGRGAGADPQCGDGDGDSLEMQSERHPSEPPADDAGSDSDADGSSPSPPSLQIDPVDVRDLLRKALEPPAVGRRQTVLPGVQRRIRAETQGRFFADGWSTSVAPRATYLVTAIVMLLVTVALWLLLRPQDVELLR